MTYAAARKVYPKFNSLGLYADDRPSYRKEAAKDGWKQMLAWLKQHGVEPRNTRVSTH